MENVAAEDVEAFTYAADLLLVDKDNQLKIMQQLSKNCIDVNAAVFDRNKWIITLYGGASLLASIISLGSRRFWCFSHLSMSQMKIPFSADVVILSSIACSGGLLLQSHIDGWNKLNQHLRDYVEEYGNLELIHCNGIRLAYGYLGPKRIFQNANLIPIPLQLKICKLLGGEIFKAPLAASVCDVSALDGEIPNPGEKFKVNHLRSAVAKTPGELKAHHGSELRLLSVGSVVAIIGIGLWGFYSFNAGDHGIFQRLSYVKSLPVWSLVRSLNADYGAQSLVDV